jgi:hypothetical protein
MCTCAYEDVPLVERQAMKTCLHQDVRMVKIHVIKGHANHEDVSLCG